MMNFLILAVLFQSTISFALTGDEVIEMIKKHNQGFGSEVNEMTLILKDGNKTIAERKMKSKSIELNGDVSIKSFLEFTYPMDVKGTRLLTWLQKKEDKSQWIYLPALNKIRRIVSGNQGSSFMGSEFTYEDIGGLETPKFNYKLLSEKITKEDTLWSVEQRPKETGKKEYQVLFIKKSFMSPVIIQYFNARNEKVKESKIGNFKEYKIQNKVIFRPDYISMKNFINGKESVFRWEKRSFGEKLRENEFSSSSMDLKR